jgi:hypothetical protein
VEVAVSINRFTGRLFILIIASEDVSAAVADLAVAILIGIEDLDF